MKEAPERVPNRNPGSEIRRFTLDYHIRHFMVPLQPRDCAPFVPQMCPGRLPDGMENALLNSRV